MLDNPSQLFNLELANAVLLLLFFKLLLEESMSFLSIANLLIHLPGIDLRLLLLFIKLPCKLLLSLKKSLDLPFALSQLMSPINDCSR